MTGHKIQSEVLVENDGNTEKLTEGSAITKFAFICPAEITKNSKQDCKGLQYDEDGDLVVERRREEFVSIEHSTSTELQLVGLQIWRGAFLLADYILSNLDIFRDKVILELGSGVGFDSIIASIVAKDVICTDVNMGDILKLIERNFRKNKSLVKCKYCVSELNFLNTNWSEDFKRKLDNVDIIMAADVIYDDTITEGFVKTLAKLFESKKNPTAYVALEKRFVFTIADLDSVAPMYEEFLRCIQRNGFNWNIEYLKTDFRQYFKYQRLDQLILMKITKRG